MSDSKAPAIPIPFGHRLAVIMQISLLVQAVNVLLNTAISVMVAYRIIPISNYSVQSMLGFFVRMLVLGLAFLFLWRSNVQRNAGMKNWLARLNTVKLALGIIGALLLCKLMPYTHVILERAPEPYVTAWLMSAISTISGIITCYVWLWWCNLPPRRERLIVVTALAWGGFSMMLVLIQWIVPSPVIAISKTGNVENMPGATAMPGGVTVKMDFSSSLLRSGREMFQQNMLSVFFRMISQLPIAGVVASLLYAGFDQVRRLDDPSMPETAT